MPHLALVLDLLEFPVRPLNLCWCRIWKHLGAGAQWHMSTVLEPDASNTITVMGDGWFSGLAIWSIKAIPSFKNARPLTPLLAAPDLLSELGFLKNCCKACINFDVHGLVLLLLLVVAAAEVDMAVLARSRAVRFIPKTVVVLLSPH